MIFKKKPQWSSLKDHFLRKQIIFKNQLIKKKRKVCILPVLHKCRWEVLPLHGSSPWILKKEYHYFANPNERMSLGICVKRETAWHYLPADGRTQHYLGRSLATPESIKLLDLTGPTGNRGTKWMTPCGAHHENPDWGISKGQITWFRHQQQTARKRKKKKRWDVGAVYRLKETLKDSTAWIPV